MLCQEDLLLANAMILVGIADARDLFSASNFCARPFCFFILTFLPFLQGLSDDEEPDDATTMDEDDDHFNHKPGG